MSKATFTATLCKKQSKHTDPATIKQQLIQIATRGVAGDRKVWAYSKPEGFDKPAIQKDGGVLYTSTIRFSRYKNADKPMLDAEMKKISEIMQRTGNNLKWSVEEVTPIWANTISESIESTEPNVSDFVHFERALDYHEIVIPDILIHGSDEDIENHPSFRNIYGLAAHVRMMASTMMTMLLTKGVRRNHLVLYGLPACGKSTLFHCWQDVLPRGSFLRMNANSTTKAGLEKLFLKDLQEVGIPPFIFVEEMEKTLEVILTSWLSILDERAEVRKITYRGLRHTEVRSLIFGTVNDKLLFDKLMGGRPNNPGALSSRMTGVYVPRPSSEVLRRILKRDINLYYPEAGKDSELWINACLELAEEVKTNDPRKVTTFLDGRDRLLTGEHQSDIINLYKLEEQERHNRFVEDDLELEAEWLKPKRVLDTKGI